MASYRLLIKPSAAKELEALPLKDRRRVVARTRELAAIPRPMGAEKLSGLDRAFGLDRGLKLSSAPGNFFNWGGRQEQWVLGDGRWYFITPDGSFHKWNGIAGANGTRLTTLPTSYYTNVDLLLTAQSTGTLASQTLLDDVFVDNPLL